jgi:hypothetical protein
MKQQKVKICHRAHREHRERIFKKNFSVSSVAKIDFYESVNLIVRRERYV